MELPQNCQTAAELWHIDISCLLVRPSLLLFTPVLFVLLSADEATGYGPVFEEQPVETIYPEESPEAKITMSCRARANPPATYK